MVGKPEGKLGRKGLAALKGEVGDATVEGAGVNAGRGGGKVSQLKVRRQAARRRENEVLDIGSWADVYSM